MESLDIKPHRWDVTPREAIAIQRQLSKQIDLTPLDSPIELIAGVDTGFTDAGRTARAAITVFRYPAIELVDSTIALDPVQFPYIPGLPSFREIPVVLKALGQIQHQPDLLLCDGQGIAHPRRLGIAAHLGLLTDIPSIGVGKSRLFGQYAEPDTEKGAHTPLLANDERIGTVLRSRTGVKPLFLSPGHRVSQTDTINWVQRCLTRYRLPEPIRAADRLASARNAKASTRQ